MRNHIDIQDMKIQEDGRYEIKFYEDGKLKSQANAAYCCVGEKTTLSDGSRVFCIYYEVVDLDYNKEKII